MLQAYDSPPDWYFRVMTLVPSGCYTAIVGLVVSTLENALPRGRRRGKDPSTVSDLSNLNLCPKRRLCLSTLRERLLWSQLKLPSLIPWTGWRTIHKEGNLCAPERAPS
jgi:hypothetical protein